MRGPLHCNIHHLIQVYYQQPPFLSGITSSNSPAHDLPAHNSHAMAYCTGEHLHAHACGHKPCASFSKYEPRGLALMWKLWEPGFEPAPHAARRPYASSEAMRNI
ncbi:hypothetical protein HanRHA438_Chr10g0467171 [Helianthus annuus]|nr:hypothetical protein HanRHA438_Chr10g0467171 [Helianthus annuus]